MAKRELKQNLPAKLLAEMKAIKYGQAENYATKAGLSLAHFNMIKYSGTAVKSDIDNLQKAFK